MRRQLPVLTVLFAIAVLSPVGAAAAAFPDQVPLPDGFFPEGIAIDGHTAYVGSLIDGTIQQQNLRTGATDVFAPSPGPGAIAVGMDVDAHGRLWVAGGGPALDPSIAPGYRVYDHTGTLIEDVVVPTAGFVNDVIVTRDAAWLTDSFGDALIRVPVAPDGSIGAAESVTLTGDFMLAQGFNANGIVVTPDQRTLIVAQSTDPVDGDGAALYAVPAGGDAPALPATRIAVDGPLPGADGLVINGRTLYSVAGPAGVVTLRLDGPATTATVVETRPVPGSVTPTTAALRGGSLYVVDAKFPFFGDPTVPFVTTAIPR